MITLQTTPFFELIVIKKSLFIESLSFRFFFLFLFFSLKRQTKYEKCHGFTLTLDELYRI